MWTAQGILKHDTKPLEYIYSNETFETKADCLEWINGDDGDMFANCLTIDTKTVEYHGYWLDDIQPHNLEGTQNK
jgi:hypothetical protein